MSYIYVIKVYM